LSIKIELFYYCDLIIFIISESMSELIQAVRNHNFKLVNLLLSNGADVNYKDIFGSTALIWSTRYNMDIDIVELLILKGANINDKNNKGNTALITASAHRTINIVELLLSKGASIHDKNNEGNTALIEASNHPCTIVVKLLLLKGANVHDKNNDGDAAYTKTSNSKIQILLKSYGYIVPKSIIEYFEEDDFIKVFELCNLNVTYMPVI
jgi:ankyrin repeat protein